MLQFCAVVHSVSVPCIDGRCFCIDGLCFLRVHMPACVRACRGLVGTARGAQGGAYDDAPVAVAGSHRRLATELGPGVRRGSRCDVRPLCSARDRIETQRLCLPLRNVALHVCVRVFARARVCTCIHLYTYQEVSVRWGLVVCRYYYNSETNATSWLKPILHDESGIASHRTASRRVASHRVASVFPSARRARSPGLSEAQGLILCGASADCGAILNTSMRCAARQVPCTRTTRRRGNPPGSNDPRRDGRTCD